LGHMEPKLDLKNRNTCEKFFKNNAQRLKHNDLRAITHCLGYSMSSAKFNPVKTYVQTVVEVAENSIMLTTFYR
jgi:hypothetical protein